MFRITDDCVLCGMGDEHYEIDSDVCISCESCATNCPVGAPVEE